MKYAAAVAYITYKDRCRREIEEGERLVAWRGGDRERGREIERAEVRGREGVWLTTALLGTRGSKTLQNSRSFFM